MTTDIPEDQTIAATINTNLRERINNNATHIELFYKGKSFSFGKSDLPITIGRDNNKCDISVASHIASRVHCSIEVQDNQIGVLDSSKNGTVIQMGRNEGIAVKGKFFPLLGQGHIQLGGVADHDLNHVLFKTRFEDND